jgi:large subunit ribosomal protein L1
MALSKRIKTIQEKIDTIKDYDIEEAIELLKSAPKVKFNESVDLQCKFRN